MSDIPPQARPDGGLGALLSDLVRDLAGLFRSETRLIRAELAEAGRSMARGVELMGVGAVVIIVALIVLAQAAVIALAPATGPGWAALIVGGVLAIAGVAFILSGRKAVSAARLVPEKTLEQTSRDVQMAKEQLS